MNSVSALATFIPKTCMRRLSVVQVRGNKVNLSKIQRKQVQFQMDNNIPVYLRGGPMDYVFYYSTVALIFIGLSASLRSCYMLATKK